LFRLALHYAKPLFSLLALTFARQFAKARASRITATPARLRRTSLLIAIEPQQHAIGFFGGVTAFSG
jgi:hypothetical protein